MSPENCEIGFDFFAKIAKFDFLCFFEILDIYYFTLTFSDLV